MEIRISVDKNELHLLISAVAELVILWEGGTRRIKNATWLIYFMLSKFLGYGKIYIMCKIRGLP